MHVETRYFFYFGKCLRNNKEFSKLQEVFCRFCKVLFCYKRSGTFSETFLTLSLFACNIFSRKETVGLSFLINLKFRKVYCQKTKIQKHPGSQLDPTSHFQCYLSLSVWCVSIIFCSISIICVSQEELSLIEYNEQIHFLHVSSFYLKKDIVESNFLISVN